MQVYKSGGGFAATAGLGDFSLHVTRLVNTQMRM